MQAQHSPFEGFAILRPITPQELDISGLYKELLYKSMQNDPLSIPIDKLLDAIYAHEVVMWTWGDGILLTEFANEPCGLVLWVTNVCGKGYLKALLSIDKDIVSVAKTGGAKYIFGDVPHEGLVKAYRARGARVINRVFREVR